LQVSTFNVRAHITLGYCIALCACLVFFLQLLLVYSFKLLTHRMMNGLWSFNFRDALSIHGLLFNPILFLTGTNVEQLYW